MAKQKTKAKPEGCRPIDSTFAILDVKKGRAALAKRLDKGEHPYVLVIARIDGQHSKDDGVSREFSLLVENCVELPASFAPSTSA